ncbi:MAG: PorT family protein [Bacteroidales bacterium]|nr:PorT family protein [Bacteroidales bacterium]
MKKVFFALAAVLMLSLTSQAQVKFGVKAGMNLSRFTENFETMKPGFHAGIYAQVKLHPMFSIQPEVLYSMQGALEEETNTTLGQTITAKGSATSHNVIVPVMLQFTPIKSLTIEAGPQFGFNLGMSLYSEVTMSGLVDDSFEESVDLGEEDYKMFDFGLAAGLKYNVNSNINVYARYVFGLTPVFEYAEDYDDAAMNQNLMFGVGFTF